MNTEVIKSDHPVALPHAVDILQNGGLVAFPTDTVYGLAALPSRDEFIECLYMVKGRESSRAIAILISSAEQLSEVSISPNDTARKLANRFWPGPLTLIVPRHPNLPDVLSPNPTIGVRVPDHELALQLLRLTGPLGVTSANLSGHENTTTAQEVLQQLDGRIHLLIDGGKSPGSVPSTVVDCSTEEPIILRSGPIDLDEIQSAISD
ncbi:MAG: L-threonylcarbamoyladenylate synthase [Anaerolineales bacterium]|nr:L-threonylcarbamoyladenylate synthase [Anaerolineales bacterium]